MRNLLTLFVIATASLTAMAANKTEPADDVYSHVTDADLEFSSTYDNITGNMYLNTLVTISNYGVLSTYNSPYIAIQYLNPNQNYLDSSNDVMYCVLNRNWNAGSTVALT